MLNLENKLKLKQLLKKSRKKRPPSARMIWIFMFLAIMGMGFMLGAMQISTHRKMRRIKDRYQSMFKTLTQGESHKRIRFLGNTLAPPKLSNIPFGEEKGIVLNVKEMAIRHAYAPFNGSLIATAEGYHLFFRHDTPRSFSREHPFCTHIGVATLDKNLEQMGEMQELPLSSSYAEDPRLVQFKGSLCLIYNDLLKGSSIRAMHLAELDPVSLKIQHITPLNLNLSWVEKNWSPFVYKERLMLEYQINPHVLFELSDLTSGALTHVTLPQKACFIPTLIWEKIWGTLRGGTPLLKVGNKFLGFFHSSFAHSGTIWYVMGAYSFSAEPPFYLESISEYPLLFEGIYDTAFVNAADANKRVIFPCGFVTAREGGRDVILLACGENDCSIKIVTLDQESLLKSLRSVESPWLLQDIFQQSDTEISP